MLYNANSRAVVRGTTENTEKTMKTNRSLMPLVLALSLLFGVRAAVCAQSITLTNVSPNSFPSGPFTLTLTGTGFTPSCVVKMVNAFAFFDFVTTTTTYNSFTQLTVSGTAYAGYSDTPFQVNVYDTATKQTSNTVYVTIAPPLKVYSIIPDNAPAGSNGYAIDAYYDNGPPEYLFWSGNGSTTGLSGRRVLPSTVQFYIPASLLTKPGVAYLSSSGYITVPFYITGRASISSLSPSTASAGDAGFMLTVNGIGFISGDVVQWNGSALPTTLVSGRQLQAAVPASYVRQTGNAQVTVDNLSPVSFSISTVHVAGKVNLQAEAQAAQVVTLEFRPVSSGATQTFTTLLASDGSFDVRGITPGSYKLAAKGYKWLRTVVPLTVGQMPVSNVQVTLLGGDANGDNVIDIADFGIIVNAYNGDASISGSGYDIRADFNDDGVIDIADFGILVNNYGLHGAN